MLVDLVPEGCFGEIDDDTAVLWMALFHLNIGIKKRNGRMLPDPLEREMGRGIRRSTRCGEGLDFD